MQGIKNNSYDFLSNINITQIKNSENGSGFTHYENKLTKTLDQPIFSKFYKIFSKCSQNQLNIGKFLHQKGVKHYVLTNGNQITPI